MWQKKSNVNIDKRCVRFELSPSGFPCVCVTIKHKHEPKRTYVNGTSGLFLWPDLNVPIWTTIILLSPPVFSLPFRGRLVLSGRFPPLVFNRNSGNFSRHVVCEEGSIACVKVPTVRHLRFSRDFLVTRNFCFLFRVDCSSGKRMSLAR